MLGSVLKEDVMKKMFALVSSLFIFAPQVFAQVSALPGEAASEFAIGVERGIYFMKPVDPFQIPQCQIVDARFFAPLSLAKAQKTMTPCLAAISSKYGVSVKVQVGIPHSGPYKMDAQVEILMLNVANPLPITHPLVRDLNYGLSRRQGKILGFPARVLVPGRFEQKA